jgi:hypothetical protein
MGTSNQPILEKMDDRKRNQPLQGAGFCRVMWSDKREWQSSGRFRLSLVGTGQLDLAGSLLVAAGAAVLDESSVQK